jgi:hypothetical protein
MNHESKRNNKINDEKMFWMNRVGFAEWMNEWKREKKCADGIFLKVKHEGKEKWRNSLGFFNDHLDIQLITS